jgi:RES domain-containing protein
MRLWRISDFTDLLGEGGVAASGRWHWRGQKVVYLSDHPASALLEILVRREVDADDLPHTYQLLAIDVADDVTFEMVEESSLSSNWRADEDATRTVGNQWLKRNSTALLRVPSAIVPFAWNWLLNPIHENWPKARLATITRVPFDPRLRR